MYTTKNTVYIKQPGQPPTPVTARIKWHANGKIEPLLYWTPDGSRYEVKRVYEAIPLAFLKDGGEGIRFKVKAEIEGGAESYYDHHYFTLHETYMYFTNSMFCGRNIIDQRYSHKGKEFIPVTLDVFQNGEYEIVFFEVQGARYAVDRTVAVEPRASFNIGGAGVWHKVEARLVDAEGKNPAKSAVRVAALYFEINKWFAGIAVSYFT